MGGCGGVVGVLLVERYEPNRQFRDRGESGGGVKVRGGGPKGDIVGPWGFIMGFWGVKIGRAHVLNSSHPH